MGLFFIQAVGRDSHSVGKHVILSWSVNPGTQTCIAGVDSFAGCGNSALKREELSREPGDFGWRLEERSQR